ncbi:MAG TPA: zinc ribbon domain-containing protein [Thermoanaerobaculia bacterium]|nr:zinc ribbon domain-containing protein [Thermoanaerobaculia bacterium]
MSTRISTRFIVDSANAGDSVHRELSRSLHRPRLSIQVLLREVQQRLHVVIPDVDDGGARLGSARRRRSPRRRLREGRRRILRSAACNRRTRSRQHAEGGGCRNLPDLQTVHPLRQSGLVCWTKSRDIAQVSGAVCKQCGAKTQGGKFCQECGAALAPTRKCAQCSHEVEGSPKFCPECGQKY